MDVDEVDRIEHVLSATTLLVAIGKFGDSDRNVQARQVLLREGDLLRELGVREDVVEQRLGAELYAAGDELGERVRVQ